MPVRTSPAVMAFPKSAALDALADGIMATNTGTPTEPPTVVYVNDAVCEMTGYAREELLGRSPGILQGPATDQVVIARLRADLDAGRSFAGQAVNYRKDGSAFLMEWSIAAIDDADGRPAYFVAVQRDATVPAFRLMRAEHDARTDALTGLPNRAHVDEILDSGSWLSTRVHSAIVVAVDHFKAINDQHGHLVGDEVLRLMARRLTASVRGGDLVARWGGEEFCVLMIGDRNDPSVLGARIVTAVAETPFKTSAGPLTVTVSAGSASATTQLDRAVDILRAADEALFRAKRGGRNRAEHAG